MAGRYKIHRYLTTIAVTVILLTVSQPAAARLKKKLCIQTAYPKLCQPVVKGSNPRRATHSTIRALEGKTKIAIAEAARFKHGNQAVKICYATFTDAIHNLGKARKSIKKRQMRSLKKFLTAAVSDYGACVDAFIESRQINRLQNVADELRKMGTNCLLLSTLI